MLHKLHKDSFPFFVAFYFLWENKASYCILTQLKERKLFLEDPIGNLQLNLYNFLQMFITEGNIILAEGTYDDKMFKLSHLHQLN